MQGQNKISIRKATVADMNVLLQFEQGVIQAERPFDSTLQDDPIRYYNIEEMIRAPHIELVVAVVGEELAGCGYARIERARPYLKHLEHAYLGFMYVVPHHRGKGINKEVIEALRQWAASQGVMEMCLEVYVGNETAIQAYERIGFQKQLFTMRRGV
jgi:GNAT superfamily N-acetyltransferase